MKIDNPEIYINGHKVGSTTAPITIGSPPDTCGCCGSENNLLLTVQMTEWYSQYICKNCINTAIAMVKERLA